MVYGEYLSWIKYKEKHGSLNIGERVDRALAFVALRFAQMMAKKQSGAPWKLEDFSLTMSSEEKGVGSPAEVFSLLSSVAASNPNDGD